MGRDSQWSRAEQGAPRRPGRPLHTCYRLPSPDPGFAPSLVELSAAEPGQRNARLSPLLGLLCYSWALRPFGRPPCRLPYNAISSCRVPPSAHRPGTGGEKRRLEANCRQTSLPPPPPPTRPEVRPGPFRRRRPCRQMRAGRRDEIWPSPPRLARRDGRGEPPLPPLLPLLRHDDTAHWVRGPTGGAAGGGGRLRGVPRPAATDETEALSPPRVGSPNSSAAKQEFLPEHPSAAEVRRKEGQTRGPAVG